MRCAAASNRVGRVPMRAFAAIPSSPDGRTCQRPCLIVGPKNFPELRNAQYLKDVFKAQLADDPKKAVISDCRVDWNLSGVRPLGPDVAAFGGIKRHRDWSTFDVKAEGAKPLLVVEVTSPDTRDNDVVL